MQTHLKFGATTLWAHISTWSSYLRSFRI
jgi:hypothetical protein